MYGKRYDFIWSHYDAKETKLKVLETVIRASHRLHPVTFGNEKLVFDKISKFCTQCVFKNIKMKVYNAMIAHNLKSLYSKPAPKFSWNLGKFEKFLGDCPWWSEFLIKLQVCSTLARIRKYHLYCLVTS